jgi:hypothetical protein
MSDIKAPRRWVKGDSRVAKHLSISVMTVSRWSGRPDMKFPKPVIINKTKFYDLEQIDDWVAEHAGRELDTTGIDQARRIKEEKRRVKGAAEKSATEAM